MKKTNSITLLILLVLCVTIAGAYATWNYTTSENIKATDPQNVSVNLAESVVETVNGGTLTVTGKIAFLIDNDGQYNAKLVPTEDSTNLVVKYTAPDDASPTAISMQATIEVQSAKYKEVVVITLENSTLSTGPVEAWTITPTDILSCLKIADINLPTVKDYEAFKTALGTTTTAITVTIAAQ